MYPVSSAYFCQNGSCCINIRVLSDMPHTEARQVACLDLYLSKLSPGGIPVTEDVRNMKTAKRLQARCRKEAEILDLRKVKRRLDDIMVIVRN